MAGESRAEGTDWSTMASILRLRTTIVGTQGSPYVSTQYFTGSTSPEASDAASAVAAFWGALDVVMDGGMAWNIEPFCDVINDATGALVGIVDIGGGNSGTGAASGDPLPWATQGLLRFSTGVVVAGRALRGRLFIPGATEADNEEGVPRGAYRTTVADAYAALQTATPGALRIYSRKHGTSSVVTGGSPWTQWATLRSRRD